MLRRAQSFPLVGFVVALGLAAACSPAAPPGQSPGPTTTAPTAPAQQEAKANTGAPATKTAPTPAAKASFDEQAVANFYRGKTIRIIVGFAPGGGFDSYSRLIARHMGKHIPGNPTIIVENMDGAGSLVAANHVANVAPRDGTVIGNFHGNLIMQQAFGAQGVQFDAAQMGFLGVPTRDRNLCVASGTSGFKSLKEAQNPGGREIVFGADAPGSTTHDVIAVLKEALDLNAKIVPGYTGTSRTRLAMEQGEVDGLCGWSWESVKTSNYDDVVNGTIVPIVQVTDKPIADMPVKDVPLARDLARTEEGKQLIKAGIENVSNFNRPYLLPPAVPAERVAALQQALAATFKDPAFLADAEQGKLDISPVSPQELEQLVKETLAMPAEVKARLKAIMLPS